MKELQLKLHDDVYAYCVSSIENTEFVTVEEYLEFVIAEVVEKDNCGTRRSRDTIDGPAEEQLNALGYI